MKPKTWLSSLVPPLVGMNRLNVPYEQVVSMDIQRFMSTKTQTFIAVLIKSKYF